MSRIVHRGAAERILDRNDVFVRHQVEVIVAVGPGHELVDHHAVARIVTVTVDRDDLAQRSISLGTSSMSWI